MHMFITRKFSLHPEMNNVENKLEIIKGIRNQFLKFRDIENEFIEFAVQELRKDPSLIDQFQSESTVAYKGNFYDYFNFNLYIPKTHKNIEFKERVKRCAAFYPYYALRNWLIKNENLKVIINDLIQVFSNQKYRKHAFLSFVSKGMLGKKFLKAMNSHLKRDIFGGVQLFSNEYLKNHINYLRNLLVSNRALDGVLRQKIQKIVRNPRILEDFSDNILFGFKRKERKKEVLIAPNDLAEYFAGMYIRIIKSRTTKLARQKLHSPGKFSKASSFLLRERINSYNFETIEEFQRERDEDIIDDLRERLEKSSYIYDRQFLLEKIKELLKEYMKELGQTNRNLTKSMFKPVFSRVQIKSLDQAGFEVYCFQKLKQKIKETIKNLFLSKDIALETINTLTLIRDNIYNIIPIPKMKKLTIPIVSYEQIYKFYDNDLSARLKLIKGMPADKLHISPPKYSTKSKREVEREKRFLNLNNIYDKVPPTLKLEGRKIILCQPFYAIKGGNDHSQLDEKNGKIVMGIDLGLKHFAVISVRDEAINTEIARYFLNQRALFDMMFDNMSGRFLFQNEFKRTNPTNIKWKLIHLRGEIRDVQSKKNEYEDKYPHEHKRIYHILKTLSCLWNKLNNIHSEIVNQLTHKIVKIAQYHGVSAIKFENLKWAKHSKRIEVGQFLTWNQVHWFYSQIQWHVAQMAARKKIEVVLVDARDTSKICFECRLFRPNYSDKIGATRIGKQFVCIHSSHARLQLDADLNAARNIALSATI